MPPDPRSSALAAVLLRMILSLLLLALLAPARASAFPGGFIFSWSDSNEPGRVKEFVVLRRVTGSGEAGWSEVARVPSYARHYVDRAVQPLVRYEYAVRAFSGGNESELSDPLGLSFSGRLANISTRGRVGRGDDILIGGFVVADYPQLLLIRGVGPGLARWLPAGAALADPQLQIVRALPENQSETVATNDNWNAAAPELVAAMEQVHAFALAPGSRDAALLLTLPPGRYTALLSGVDDAEGVALIEIYEVQTQ